MRHTVSVLSLAALVSLTATPIEVEACQPPPSDLMGFSATFPSDGATGVPIDAGFVFVGTAIIEAGYDYPGDFTADTVEVVDAGGEPVSGTMVPWYAGQGEFEFAWAPTSPLTADSAYSVEATLYRGFSGDYTEEELALGSTVVAAFTTGSGTTAPLAAGALALRTTEVVVEIEECPNVGDCGISCVVVGTRTVPELVITLPEVDGGNDVAGYSAYFAVSAGAPLPFTEIAAPSATEATPLIALRSSGIASEGPTEVTIQLNLTDSEPFVPCVSAIVWDASGKRFLPEPVCATDELIPPSTDDGGGAGGSGLGGSGSSVGGAGGTLGARPATGGEVTNGGSGVGGTADIRPATGGVAAGGDGIAAGGNGIAAGGTAEPRSSSGGTGSLLDTAGSPAAEAGAEAGTETEPPVADNPPDVGTDGDGCSGCRTSPQPVSQMGWIAAFIAVLFASGRARRMRSE